MVRPPLLIRRLLPQPVELDSRDVSWEMIRTRCACGGEIVAANQPGMIQAAVMAHQQTRLHRAWRKRHGL